MNAACSPFSWACCSLTASLASLLSPLLSAPLPEFFRTSPVAPVTTHPPAPAAAARASTAAVPGVAPRVPPGFAAHAAAAPARAAAGPAAPAARAAPSLTSPKRGLGEENRNGQRGSAAAQCLRPGIAAKGAAVAAALERADSGRIASAHTIR